ncbi:pitrilysin family protein [Leptolyngbya sp. FACHB-261]|uniref:M16 family metallopeptidase n=1 Tax=Leptolyngbya sp. FACHB-261 TaxID=2692806 RepID=UPI001684D97C|nr:pitrilysin family protein [Leptolyngbya sp. FACHB-261]MBD2101325.1 insulinase family protein [Leptolyngbya sp. FACHB-261]
MSLLGNLRRYGLPGLFFGLCLSAVFYFGGPNHSAQLAASAAPSPIAVAATPGAPPNAQSLSTTENVRKTVLANGLTVLTKEIHTSPVVSVQVWYRVGSRNETAGLSGISHQLEHLLFKGTTQRPIQFGRLFSALGSASNAFTSYDETAYFGTVERDKLDALLTLEADRMENSLINPESLTSEKRVVISELQGYENSPNYRLNRAVMRAAFPQRAYGLPVGGTKADVEKFTVEQVRQYYRTYYSPSNATLVITGDFQTEPVLAAVQKAFGKVPKLGTTAQAPAAQAASPSSQAAKAPLVLREPGSAALLKAVYPLPNVNHPDVAALNVLDYVLTGGRSSRLYQALVESGLASDVSGYAATLIESGWYELNATAAPGQNLSKIDQVLQQTLTALRDRTVTEEELKRAKTQLQAAITLQSRDITSQAFQLGDDQTSAGDYRYRDHFLAAVEQVRAADVQRVARTYFSPQSRTIGFFEPTQVDGRVGTAATGSTQTAEQFNLGPPVDPSEVAKYLPPSDSTDTRTPQALPETVSLPNGLRVLLLPDRSTPTVTLSGYVQAGSEFDTTAKAGLASLTAENLMNGAQGKDALTLAKTLEDRGASLGFSANREGVIISSNALAADLTTVTQTLASVLQQATFPAQELELSRQRALTALKVELDNPARLGRRAFQQAVYPNNHPFYAFPSEASLKGIDRSDLVNFYRAHYRPDTTVLTLLGDFEPSQARALLEREFGSWQASGKPPALEFPPVPLPKAVVRLNPVLPGKAQSITYLGYSAIDRKDPRFYAALVLNEILGGNTLASRLGTEIRDRQGLTYGIYSYFQAGINAGPFLIQMQTAPEDAQRAVDSTLRLLKQLRDQGVTSNELAAAKRSITNSYPVGLADPDSVANTILMNAVYGLGREEIRQFPSQIEAVTLQQVNQTAKELLSPDNLVVVTAGPAVSGTGASAPRS